MWTSRTESLIEGHYFNKCVCAESIILTGLKTLAPWKESYDKPRQCIKKQRHHFVTKVHVVKAVVFPVVTYGCEGWTIKKVQRIDTKLTPKNWDDLWCWRILFRVPWIAGRSYRRSILNIRWKDWCWSCSSIFWPPDAKSDALEKTLMLGKIEGGRRRGHWQRMRWLGSITSSTDMNLSKLREMMEVRERWHAVVHSVAESLTQRSNRTTRELSSNVLTDS